MVPHTDSKSKFTDPESLNHREDMSLKEQLCNDITIICSNYSSNPSPNGSIARVSVH